MAGATSTVQENLVKALETRDSKLMLRLCGELNSNLVLTAGGYQATVAHHVALTTEGSHGLQCISKLVRQFGCVCLKIRDCYDNTVLHLAAQHQDSAWLKLIVERLDKTCLDDLGQSKATVVHFAALNIRNSSALKWLVRELGPGCLLKPDGNGDTAIHLAARMQGVETLKFLQASVNSLKKNDDTFFGLQGWHQRSVIHFAAVNERGPVNLLWLVNKCPSSFLLLKDKDGNTPAHLAAMNHPAYCLQEINDKISTGGTVAQYFLSPNQYGETVVHCAARNAPNNSSLGWCISTLGCQCLLDKNSSGATPVHLAAQFQGLDSLRLVVQQLGTSAFDLRDEVGRTVVEYAMLNSGRERLLNWIAEQKPSANPVALPPQKPPKPKVSKTPEQEAQPPLPTSDSTNDPETTQQAQEDALKPRNANVEQSPEPEFNQWEFVLDECGKKIMIGSGSFGKVYKILTDKYQVLAMKAIDFSCSKGRAEFEKAIEQEREGIKILKIIKHPNVMVFHKSQSTENGKFRIFTEFISGHSLYDLMRRRKKPFEESGVRIFSQQICSALNYLHCYNPAVLHRDIKCSNIMLTNEGVIKLIDFGLAKEIISSTVAHITFNPSGTWHFMAPELFSEDGKLVYTPKTDVWAFGCAVFEMLHMHPPNKNVKEHKIPNVICSTDMPELTPGSSDRLRSFYRRCVAREPEERADTKELLEHEFLRVSQ